MPISTKKQKSKHGFGLKSIRRIVDKFNGNIKMYFDDDKMIFHTIIAIQDNS
jgi:sensor histidine kinase regulating citrate/malate metabolism